ncbi:uncharacterized protein LOC109713048 isoform X3 [Ananas comosus]|uniref:Uncharacterized protein LOC109713048 isoform X3 n=1 Tax=Ananas comosus TaxID=4615 RepID=A0A6P5FH89_ANACO|nr:uncharacterized protein LOC109713048 isoform X3 [Ananas comosus]
MRSKTNGAIQRTGKLNNIQGHGPNWVLVAGGALLSMLTIRLGCKLKQAFERKRQDNTIKGNGKSPSTRRSRKCRLHSNLNRFNLEEDSCYYCLSDIKQIGEVCLKCLDQLGATYFPLSFVGGGVDTRAISKEADPSLPLVKFTGSESNNENGGVMWASSPHASESGSSDIYAKREVIHKLRQQLKRRDEMIMEMQAQITDLQTSLRIQVSESANLQAQLDSANRDLFDSEREIQQLRKVIADHRVAVNGRVNGFYTDSVDDHAELRCVAAERRKGDGANTEILRKEVGELKEVIEGKDFLLQSYKEQKVELWSKMKELQLRLESQVPNIL